MMRGPITTLIRVFYRSNVLNIQRKTCSIVENQHRAMSSSISLDIKGVYPPIATPFAENEDIDFSKLKENIGKLNQIGLRGYCVLGSNGECAYLTFEERVEMVKKVREWTPKEKLIIAGSGLESTKQTIHLTEAMAKVGADAVLVITPCYYKGRMNSQALISHYTQVANASPVPVILYSVPANTGIDLDPEVIVSLASHPNIIGLKDSGGDIAKIANLVYRTQQFDFQILAGSASFLYPALTVGAVGGICALSNVLAGQTVELQSLHTAGKHGEACELQHRLVAPNAAVTKMFGVPGLKRAMEWFGYYGGPTRSPLQPITPTEEQILRKIFSDNGFLS